MREKRIFGLKTGNALTRFQPRQGRNVTARHASAG